jgi:flagellar hook-basal body complex protein FliE
MSMVIRGIDQTPGAAAADSLRSIEGATASSESNASEGPERASFGSILGNLLGEASQLEHTAAVKSEQVARGTLDDLHGTMIAVKEAEISMKLVGSVRNKLIDAFQEIWRTNV